jgi:hypothetical protein
MDTRTRDRRTWTDEQLREAVAAEVSWRAVARHLGLKGNSAGVLRAIKRHAVRIEVDSSHFTGQRRWSDAQLKAAVLQATCWADVLAALDMTDRAESRARVKGHAVRLGLDVDHLRPAEPVTMQAGIQRVQVKSTTSRMREGRWQVGIGRRPYSLDKTAGKAPYDPDTIDLFFIVDGDGALYLIPSKVLAGRVGVITDVYAAYNVGDGSGLLR